MCSYLEMNSVNTYILNQCFYSFHLIICRGAEVNTWLRTNTCTGKLNNTSRHLSKMLLPSRLKLAWTNDMKKNCKKSISRIFMTKKCSLNWIVFTLVNSVRVFSRSWPQWSLSFHFWLWAETFSLLQNHSTQKKPSWISY